MQKVDERDVLRLEFQSIFSVDPADTILLEMAREFTERTRGVGLEHGLMGYTHCSQEILTRDESERARHKSTFKKCTTFARLASTDLFFFYAYPHVAAYMTFSESYWDRDASKEAWRFRCFVDFRERHLQPGFAMDHMRNIIVPRLQGGLRFFPSYEIEVTFILRNNTYLPNHQEWMLLTPETLLDIPDVEEEFYAELDLTTDEELTPEST
jgi:hypothetical protein